MLVKILIQIRGFTLPDL